MADASLDERSRKTIADFGEQWTRFDNKAGYLGSLEQLAEQISPFLAIADLRGLKVADVGAGTGRVAAQLVAAGVAEVTAVEPSEAFDRLARVATASGGRIAPLRVAAHALPAADFDLIVCFGVLHHIPDPGQALRAFLAALRPEGRALIWVYGREGNEGYLALALPLRAVTRRLPAIVLDALVWTIYPFLRLYMLAALRVPLPLHEYVRRVLSKLSPAYIRLTIYDQLNPHYARYYCESEIRQEFADAGFLDIETAHKNGYSWLVSGRRGAVASGGR